jgi:asparagine synthase (glutamine-hydrolysing)
LAPLLSGAGGHRLAGTKMTKLGTLLRQESVPAMYRSLMSAAWQEPEFYHSRIQSAGSPIERALDRTPDVPLFDRMMLVDQQTYLPDDLLAKVDRASMAVSLEARVPILDHRVVEFAWRLPQRFKTRDGRGKWALRQVLYRRVDPALVDRPKVGFSVPLDSWLRGPLRQWSEDLLLGADAKTEWLRMDRVQRTWAQFQSGRNETALGLWAILMFKAWEQRWLQ